MKEKINIEKIIQLIYYVVATFLAFFIILLTLPGALYQYLKITNQDIVVKGSYILKSDMIDKKILVKKAIDEIENLEKDYERINDDRANTQVWLLQVLVFIHALNLEKDFIYKDEPVYGQKISSVEADIRYAQMDKSIQVQGQKTLGCLKGLRAALKARIESQ